MLKTLLQSIFLCPEIRGFVIKSLWNIMELFILHVIRHTSTNGLPVQTRTILGFSLLWDVTQRWLIVTVVSGQPISHGSSCPRTVGLGTRLTRCYVSEHRDLDSHSRQNLKITSTECLLDW